jgi:hypothetical protein
MCENNENGLMELELRLRRIERQVLEAESKYEFALLQNNPQHILQDLLLDIENLLRKLDWFDNAIKRAKRQQYEEKK